MPLEMLKSLKIKLFLLPLFFLASLAANSEAQQVYYGGVGFISWDDRDQLFPQSSKLLCRTASTCSHGNIDVMARPYFMEKTFSKFKLKTLVGEKQVEGVIMAPMIARESVGITEDITAGKKTYIHVYRIFASVMFFEFGEGRFIASRPVVLQYTDVLDHPASDAEQFSIFSDLVGTEKLGINLFKSLHEGARDVDPSIVAEKFAQVIVNNLGESVKGVISKGYKEASWKTQVGQIFESNLVKQTGAPLIPSMGQEQLGGELQGTFRDASYKITLAEPFFRVALDVEVFKSFQKISGPKKTICHAVKIGMRVGSELEEMMNAKFKRTQRSCTVVHVSKVMDPLFYFQGSLFSLLYRLSRQFGGKPLDGFLEAAAPGQTDVEKSIQRVKEEVFKVGL